MKKKLAVLGVLVVLLAVLAAVYALTSKKEDENTIEREETTENTSLPAVIKIADDVNLTEIKAERINLPEGLGVSENYDLNDKSLRVYLKGESFYIEGAEAFPLNEDNMSAYINGFYSLYASQELTSYGELGEYGLENPNGIFTAAYDDGSEATVSIGNPTADRNDFYVKTSLSDSVYVVSKSNISRYFYGLNDLLDKSLTDINKEEITLVSVVDKTGEKDLLISYEGAEAETEGNNMTTLIMTKPQNGLTVYPYNLQTTIFSGSSMLKLVDIVELNPKDLSRYGLDAPNYKLSFMDTENMLALDIGNPADDSHTYCMLPNGNAVYTTYTDAITPMIDYNIYEFTERFVNLRYRRTVSKVTIESENGENYTLAFGKDNINKEGIDNRVADLNGHSYERTEISDFYQLLTGITFERIEENAPVSGSPQLTITYYLLDGGESCDRYYAYDSNYYVVEKDGEATGFIVSKTYLSRMLSKAAELTK